MILTDDDFSTIVQGRPHRPRPLRQPEEVHPLPDGRADRLHRRRSWARASSTSRAACRSCRCRRCGSTSRRRSSMAIGLGYGEPAQRPHAAQAAPRERADPAARPARSGWRSAASSSAATSLGDHLVGRRRARRRGRADDGPHDLRDRQRLPRVHRQGPAALGLQRGDLRRPEAPARRPACPAVAILFGTELGIFQRILGTVSLTGQQWVVCLLGASTILVVSEARQVLAAPPRGGAEAPARWPWSPPAVVRFVDGCSPTPPFARRWPAPDEELQELLGLSRAPTRVELKLTIPERAHRCGRPGARHGSARRPSSARCSSSTRPTSRSSDAGVVVARAAVAAEGRRHGREAAAGRARPSCRRALRKPQGFGVEVDALPSGFVCSALVQGRAGAGDVRDVALAASGRCASCSRRSSARSSPSTRPTGIELDDLTVLGPIFVLKLKFAPEDFGRRLVAELWLYPDGSRMLELSTKCLPSEAFEVAAQARRSSPSAASSWAASSRRRHGWRSSSSPSIWPTGRPGPRARSRAGRELTPPAARSVYLVRHGPAGHYDPTRWPDDRERPLTPDGIPRFREAARGLRVLVPARGRRARQQAHPRLADRGAPARGGRLAGAGAVRGARAPPLARRSGRRASRPRRAGRPRRPRAHVLRLASLLCTGSDDALRVGVKKGSVLLLDVDAAGRAGPATLRWVLPPKALRAALAR